MYFKASRNSGGAMAWLFQRISAAVLFITLLTHFVINHFVVASNQITYEMVLQRFSSPLYRTMEFVFLVFAIYHGLNGIWMIVQDYIHRPAIRYSIYSFLCILGVVMFALGTITIFAINAPA